MGVPLNAVLDWCMGTPAGFAAFRHEAINAMFRKILRAWCEFLCGPESLYVLNDSPRGWKCASARKSTKIEQFQHKPREKHWGFTSWNDYFTRRFKPGKRPIADPDDDKVIVNACESTPYALRTNVKRAGPVLGQGPALFAPGHAGRRRVGGASSSAGRSTRRSSTPTTTTAGTARSRARSARRSSGRGPTTRRPSRRARTPKARRSRRATSRTSRRGRSS